MEEGEVRWDGLCSRDASTRDAALENIRQAVLRRIAQNSPVKEDPPPESSEGHLASATALERLNEMLARLLMLSKRCPFRDVREKSASILSNVQELGIRIPRPLGHGPSRFIPEKEAAARHQCSYLVNLHVNDFLHVGGDPKWLNGLENAPHKLQNLGELNKILAHRPWLITKEHIETTESFCEVEALMEKMKKLQECRDEEEASQEEMATRFEREKRESMSVCCSEDEESAPTRDVSRHFEDTSYGYKDFSRHGMHVPTFRVQDYSWEDHGYSLVNRLYPDVGQLIDEKFHIAYDLTYNTMAMHKDVDTSMLRRAIWNYIHCMFGIRYDDYDYGEINQLLDRSFKVYIKTVVCTPEKTTKRMYDSFWRQFKHSEKVHVNLLLVEARMQAELLYALRAITHYMT
ncbi:sestrin-1 isoform X10 [Chrysemys picta bellii]|uniref:sestrin-1 isoform X10 n=1 Tax=Chrysemys picta bellii TaxID=8478 RepID=UPI0032B1C0D6